MSSAQNAAMFTEASADTAAGFSRNELEAYWMPFSGNRQFKDNPRMIVGAEGVYLAMFPTLGLGAALKVADGAKRAAESLVAELILKLLDLDDAAVSQVSAVARPAITNKNDIVVGELRPRLW